MSETAQQDVVFYVLDSQDVEAREQFVAKLVNKIYQEQRQCDVRMESTEDVSRFDLSLWDFKPHSFIPHAAELETPAPIQIWPEHIAEPCHDVLLNLHPEFPARFGDYQRTIEVLDQTEHLVQMGRERWKQYRAQGFEPKVHKIQIKTT